ncbi:MAG TPA: LysR family transcriptional regulator [Candidatus Ligilactobacillus avistercoris]|nr:LysR family transcriptional regulator [Candidatus Ligilactobacillus avistercoris]
MKSSNKRNVFSAKALSYFLQLVETMNYTRAAKILGITQPALTQQIKRLEKAIGAPLFYSTGKTLHLSDAGYTMLDATRQVKDILNRAQNEIQQISSATYGVINVGILSSIEDTVITDFVTRYAHEHPDVRIQCYMMSRKEIWAGLDDNTLDIAILYLPDNRIKDWRTYEKWRIITDELMFLNADPHATAASIKLATATTMDWVSYPGNYYIHQVINTASEQRMATEPNYVASFTRPSQIFRFAISNRVSTVLPKSFLLAHDQENPLTVQRFTPAIHFDMDCIYRKDKGSIPRIAFFMDKFKEYLDEKDYTERLTAIHQAR